MALLPRADGRLADIAKNMPQGRSLPHNIVSRVVLGTCFVLLGYFAGNSYAQLENWWVA